MTNYSSLPSGISVDSKGVVTIAVTDATFVGTVNLQFLSRKD